MAMGGHRLSSNILRDDESASLFQQFPLSAASSPSPLLHGKAMRRPTTRRHVVIRFIRSPFTAIFRMTCARANTSDEQPSNNKAGEVRGEARRPSLEELLRMEASSSRPEHKSPQDTAPYEVSCCWKENAIVAFGFTDNAHMSCTGEEEQEPLFLSKNNHVVSKDEQQTAIVPVELDVGRQVVPGGSAAMPSPTVKIHVKRLVVVFASLWAFLRALSIDIAPSKGPYSELAGSRAAGKVELFYQRPIPMGRRCRVQHLEESPYM
ncbi:uncharacterized protein LOC133929727 [Phragmites australis]|uniref:uncharacterized protein LOC133929727 n=1 Tax=Phragmites australis TaxID=29695 RepID=UPI002D76932C|nr:uncharacterized protein LOC133929727 [Phragmites australis]